MKYRPLARVLMFLIINGFEPHVIYENKQKVWYLKRWV